jgi:hypothetical protein
VWEVVEEALEAFVTGHTQPTTSQQDK